MPRLHRAHAARGAPGAARRRAGAGGAFEGAGAASMAKKRERGGAGKEVGGEREKKAKSAAVGRHIGAVDAPIADVPFTTGDAQLALAGNAAPAGAHSPRHARATSRFRGVTHHVRTGRFEAYCWAQGSQVYLGGFAEEEQAVSACAMQVRA